MRVETLQVVGVFFEARNADWGDGLIVLSDGVSESGMPCSVMPLQFWSMLQLSVSRHIHFWYHETKVFNRIRATEIPHRMPHNGLGGKYNSPFAANFSMRWVSLFLSSSDRRINSLTFLAASSESSFRCRIVSSRPLSFAFSWNRHNKPNFRDSLWKLQII